jgi:outer membrane protein TolC
LPHLESLWDRDRVEGDEAHNATLAADLVKAEAQLSAYRAALHRRLGSATTELIARYREEPTLCVSALPLPRPKAADAHTA